MATGALLPPPARGAPTPYEEGGMAVRVVRLGSKRYAGEGLRIGTVRFPPRGVPKSRYGADDWYDVWLPDLAPTAELVRSARSASTDARWAAFARKYRAEMSRPERARLLDLLAALSHRTNFSVGCYCADESRCHRSVLGALLRERGAKMRRAGRLYDGRAGRPVAGSTRSAP
jgi:uncharacterized protein YeaO (DUF488 family)